METDKQIGDFADFIKGIEFKTDEEYLLEQSKQKDAAKKINAQTNLALLAQKIPIIFQDTDVSRLPKEKYEKALNWSMSAFKDNGGKNGLVLHGTTGMGKTRIAWEIAKQFCNENVVTNFVTAINMQEELSQSYGKKDRVRIFNEYKNTKALIIDDFGKEKSSERWESDLFEILDYRFSWKKITIFTMNLKSENFKNRFKDIELGEAVLRRIKEFCSFISV